MINDNFGGRAVTAMQLAERYSESTYFKMGYESAFKSQKFDYDIPHVGNATAYERGRAFAIWCKAMKLPRAVWRDGRAAKTVVKRLADAVVARAVI